MKLLLIALTFLSVTASAQGVPGRIKQPGTKTEVASLTTELYAIEARFDDGTATMADVQRAIKIIVALTVPEVSPPVVAPEQASPTKSPTKKLKKMP